MIKAILVGASGKMGNNICECAENDADLKIVCGVDKFNNGNSFPVDLGWGAQAVYRLDPCLPDLTFARAAD